MYGNINFGLWLVTPRRTPLIDFERCVILQRINNYYASAITASTFARNVAALNGLTM
jgi:hypothetical protein